MISKRLRDIVKNCAQKLNIELKEGVYSALTGPSYETPAEVKMLSLLGADATGMSTVPEAIVGKYCSMEVLGVSLITNYAAGVSNNPLNHEEVIETANKVKESFKLLLSEFIKRL